MTTPLGTSKTIATKARTKMAASRDFARCQFRIGNGASMFKNTCKTVSNRDAAKLAERCCSAIRGLGQALTKKPLELTMPGANNDTPPLPVFTLSLRSILIALV
jgi:hypothetical protein